MSAPSKHLLDWADMVAEMRYMAKLVFLASHGLACRQDRDAIAHGTSLLLDKIDEIKAALEAEMQGGEA